eukprot:823902-Prorocentrum_minimum.AAC.1
MPPPLPLTTRPLFSPASPLSPQRTARAASRWGPARELLCNSGRTSRQKGWQGIWRGDYTCGTLNVEAVRTLEHALAWFCRAVTNVSLIGRRALVLGRAARSPSLPCIKILDKRVWLGPRAGGHSAVALALAAAVAVGAAMAAAECVSSMGCMQWGRYLLLFNGSGGGGEEVQGGGPSASSESTQRSTHMYSSQRDLVFSEHAFIPSQRILVIREHVCILFGVFSN